MSGSRVDAAHSSAAGSPAKRERSLSRVDDSLVVPKERVFSHPRSRRRDRRWCGIRRRIVVVVLVLVVLGGVAAAVVVVVLRNRSDSTSTGGTRSAADSAASPTASNGVLNSTSRPAAPTAAARPVIGKDGDALTLVNGTTTRFVNKLGGTFATRPFDDSARSQSDSPPLNAAFDLNRHPMRGVNRAFDVNFCAAPADALS